MAQEWKLTNGVDQIVKADPGRVHALVITTIGATAGKRFTIRDGGVTGTVKFRGTIELANGVIPIPLVFRQGDPGIKCATNITFTHDDADNTVFGHLLIE